MINSEFNLYKREWLSLVFKNRNQQYGAYELRSHYGNVLSRAMAITFFAVAAFGITETVISRSKPAEEPPMKYIDVPIVPPKDNTVHEAKIKEQPKKQEAAPAKATPPVATQKYVVMTPTAEPVTEEPKALNPDMAVGPEEVKATGNTTAQNVLETGKGEGPGTGPGNGVDNNTYNIGDGIQVMPEPVGGEKAWTKFLQKNLRYPPVAQEQGVSGKVFMSFIIEKDGHLSDFTIIRKGGYGFDEEASRVLKLAPAWKPGQQNGQAVRVRYVIPINFQLAEQ
ncbi:MAG: TonB family protein [Bacteroidota bacterium]